MRRLLAIILLSVLTACGGPQLDTRTFQLRYLMESAALDIVRPYLMDRGTVAVAGRLMTVRDTRDNLERIAGVLAEHDRPPANIRLQFQIIRADGAGPADASIASIEAQLRRLFRFTGYRLLAQSSTVSTGHSGFRLRATSGNDVYDIEGSLEDALIMGDSGSARLTINLASARHGPILNTRLNIRLGHTAVIGGQPVGEAGALVLAVRAEPEVNP